MRLRFKIRYERRINAESRNTVTTSLGGMLDEGEEKKIHDRESFTPFTSLIK